MKTRIELDLSSYATKSKLKSVTGINFVKNVNELKIVPVTLNYSKRKVDRVNVDKLEVVIADLKKKRKSRIRF